MSTFVSDKACDYICD